MHSDSQIPSIVIDDMMDDHLEKLPKNVGFIQKCNQPNQNTDGYEEMLCVVQKYLGHQPPDVLSDAVAQTLALLKRTKSDQRNEIEKGLKVMLPNQIDDTDFGDVINNFIEDEDCGADADGGPSKKKQRNGGHGLWKADKEMLNPELPEGINVQLKKGYVEVYVPPLMPKPLDPGEELVKLDAMPDWAQSAFEGMAQLNRIPSKVYNTAFYQTDNILLCAPPGAGEREVAILTILNHLGSIRNPNGSFQRNGDRIVYLVPMEAGVPEVVGDLSNRFQHYNVVVKGIDWDQKLNDDEVVGTQIIVATPEKWDIVSRKSGNRAYVHLVKLIIFDQIHLLHGSRGPVLEIIIARTLWHVKTSNERIRFVGLSAPLLNHEEVALFLRVDREKGLFYYDNSYRPYSLSQRYIRITDKKPLRRFQLMNDLCYEKVIAVAGKKQVVIYVHSMNETTRTACEIRDTALNNGVLGNFLKDHSVSREFLRSHKDLVKSVDLKDLLSHGIAIHHTEMATEDCKLVEDLFADGHVQVLVSTATLAWRVNLQSHIVIIKGTDIYNQDNGSWTELSHLDVMQMLGCARKVHCNSCGEGIVLSDISKRKYYMSFMNEKFPIHSQLLSSLPYQLNKEIVLGTVQNVQEACQWLGYTYLHICMLRNPALYGLSSTDLIDGVLSDGKKVDLIHAAATILDNNNLVKYKRSGDFQITDLGRISATSI